MELPEHVRDRSAALWGALLVALLLLGTTAGAASRVFARPHPGLNFSVSVPGYPGCDTSQGDAQCYIPPGTSFTANVTLDPLPSDIPSYQGYDIKLQYTGLTSADNASTAMWPACAYPATYYQPGLVNMACTIGVPPAGPSSYSGLVGTNDFTCAQSGTLSLLHGDGNTDLQGDVGIVYSEPGPAETLNITCGSPPTPTPPATATPLPGLTSAGSGGGLDAGEGGAGQWLVIGSLLGLAAMSLVVLSWRFARSR